jgi:hypothetical protein
MGIFGKDRAKALRTNTACYRAGRMTNDSCFKAALFYSHLSDNLWRGEVEDHVTLRMLKETGDVGGRLAKARMYGGGSSLYE